MSYLKAISKCSDIKIRNILTIEIQTMSKYLGIEIRDIQTTTGRNSEECD